MKTLDTQKFKRMTDVFLALPFIVTATVIAIYFAFWKTDPLIRFIHMIWVLGLWMVGTIAMFNFIVPIRLKLGVISETDSLCHCHRARDLFHPLVSIYKRVSETDRFDVACLGWFIEPHNMLVRSFSFSKQSH